MTWSELRRVPPPDPDEHASWFENVEDNLLEVEEHYRALVGTLPLARYIDRDDRDTGTSWGHTEARATPTRAGRERGRESRPLPRPNPNRVLPTPRCAVTNAQTHHCVDLILRDPRLLAHDRGSFCVFG
jgi:hypothetical protein